MSLRPYVVVLTCVVFALGAESAHASLRFGVCPVRCPLSTQHTIAGGRHKPQPQSLVSPLERLRGQQPLVVRLVSSYSRLRHPSAGLLARVAAYTQAGFLVQVDINYHSGPAPAFGDYVGQLVGELTGNPGVVGVGLASSRGGLPRALISGLLAAHQAAHASFPVGLEWSLGGRGAGSFFRALRHAGAQTRDAIDWVGLNIEPRTASAPPRASAARVLTQRVVSAATALRRHLLPLAELPGSVRIHVAAAFPGFDRSGGEKQAATLLGSVRRLQSLASPLGVSDFQYLAFSAGDDRNASLLTGTYETKPVFRAYRRLIAEAAPPAEAIPSTPSTSAPSPETAAPTPVKSMPATPPPPPPPPPAPRTVPPQGIWDYCDVALDASSCEQRVTTAASIGFSLIVAPFPNYSPSLAGFLQTLKTNKVRALWEITDPAWWGYNGRARWGYNPNASTLLLLHPDWANACGCQTNGALLAFIVRTLTANGTTYGWYIADDSEVNSPAYSLAQFVQGVGQFSATLHSLAPATVTLNGSDGGAEFQSTYGVADLTAEEVYPIADQPQSPATLSNVADLTSSAVQVVEQGSGTGPTAFILQAFDQSDWNLLKGDRYPSAAEMLTMRNTVLKRSNPSFLLWYNLDDTIGWPTHRPGWWSGPKPPTDTSARIAALKAAVQAPFPS